MKGAGRFPLPIFFIVALVVLSRVFDAIGGDLAEDFPLFAAIAAFILFRVLASPGEKRRRGPIPMPVPGPSEGQAPKDIGFKIPPLRGAPKESRAEAPTRAAESDAGELRRQQALRRQLAEKRARDGEEERLRGERQELAARAADPGGGSFSPDALRGAVLWAEILAPPKALRKQCRGRG